MAHSLLKRIVRVIGFEVIFLCNIGQRAQQGIINVLVTWVAQDSVLLRRRIMMITTHKAELRDACATPNCANYDLAQ
jgi:hypothetical protein